MLCLESTRPGNMCKIPGLPWFLLIRLLWLAGDNQMHVRTPGERSMPNFPNSTLWEPVHCHTMINGLTKLSAESRVPGVKLPLRKAP